MLGIECGVVMAATVEQLIARPVAATPWRRETLLRVSCDRGFVGRRLNIVGVSLAELRTFLYWGVLSIA